MRKSLIGPREVDIVLSFDHCDRESAYYLWQRYYLHGFRALGQVRLRLKPLSSRLLARFLDRRLPKGTQLWDRLGHLTRRGGSTQSNHVGRYRFEVDSSVIKVAIDSADSQGIRDPSAYDWADIYFKANRWSERSYPEKVRPITSGDISLRVPDIERLRTLRASPRERDLVFLSRIWTGEPGRELEQVEHDVRLFEALARVNCDKDLLAIISPQVARHPQANVYLDRLAAAGVPVSTRLLSKGELMRRLAGAKVTFFRSGKHFAIPGRLHWYLCLGTCVVLDDIPRPQWYQPLVEGTHYISAGCGLNDDAMVSDGSDYRKITTLLENLVATPERVAQIGRSAADYFERVACPVRVAEYVIDTVGKQAGISRRKLP